MIKTKLAVIGLGAVLSFNTLNRPLDPSPVKLGSVTIMAEKPMPRPKHVSTYQGGTKDFLEAIARRESKGKQHAVSRFGYLGKYQFHPKTIRAMGIRTTKDKFLNSLALQDSAMKLFMKDNSRTLEAEIRKFSGKYHRGVYVTRSGILAAAHLAGPGGVKTFFYPNRYNHVTTDANGASVRQYMQKFANYNIEL